MAVFTDAERAFLDGQRIARLATADLDGTPDVSAVGFQVDGDVIVSGGLDLTKTIRYRHLQANPVATIVIDDLVSVDPWTPRGVKARGPAELARVATANGPSASHRRPSGAGASTNGQRLASRASSGAPSAEPELVENVDRHGGARNVATERSAVKSPDAHRTMLLCLVKAQCDDGAGRPVMGHS
jgi:pyridoxamine 5'-phosphate oxidase family protein